METDADPRHVIGRDGSLDQSHAQDLGQNVGPGTLIWPGRAADKIRFV